MSEMLMSMKDALEVKILLLAKDSLDASYVFFSWQTHHALEMLMSTKDTSDIGMLLCMKDVLDALNAFVCKGCIAC